MAAGKQAPPQQVTLTEQQASELNERIKKNALTDGDIKLMLGLIAFNLWLQQRLSRAKLTIKRLRQLFGFKSEAQAKKANPSGKPEGDEAVEQAHQDTGNNETKDADTSEPTKEVITDTQQDPSSLQWKPEQNHGRRSADDYTGCPITDVPFEDEHLKQGQCPNCAEYDTKASVYEQPPTVLVFLDSQPLLSGQRYRLSKVRCCVCQTYFTAPLPAKLKEQPKYSHACKSTLAIHHYYAGLPFKRLETLQKLQGVPVADATQYDLVNQLYDSVIKPVVGALRQCAANGNALFFDDTPGRILEQMAYNKKADNHQNKKGIHTTALLSEYNDHRIYLFNTNTLTAGKEFAAILQDRTTSDDFISMSDASASNFPTLEDDLLARWVIRNGHEITSLF